MKDHTQIDFSQLELQDLINYISNKHHAYCRQMLPLISKHLLSVTNVKEKKGRGFVSVCQSFNEFSILLDQHLRKEDEILFPFIQSFFNGSHPANYKYSNIPLIENPIHLLKSEHEKLNALLSKIRSRSYNYYTPEWASAAFKLCYTELYEFEKEFYRHLAIEENILFPKLTLLERNKTKMENTEKTNILNKKKQSTETLLTPNNN